MHAEYRLAWQHLFSELFNWSAADVEQWELGRLGTANLSDMELGVIQHHGAPHYVTKILFPRTVIDADNEAEYLRIFAEIRGVLEVAEANYFKDEPVFSTPVPEKLEQALRSAGTSLGECRHRKPPPS